MVQAANRQNDQPELTRGALKFPEPRGEIRRTSREALQQALEDLQAKKQEWVSLSLDVRIQILDDIRRDLWTVSEDWIDISMREKGVSPGTFGETEEWASFWPLSRGLRLIRQSLDDIRKLIFGTDFPWGNCHFRVGAVIYARISQEIKRKILGENIAALLGISTEALVAQSSG